MFEGLWHKYLGGKNKPWAKITSVAGKLQVIDCNAQFLAEQRKHLGEVAVNKSDREVLDTYLRRESAELEEPRLEILHSSIDETGQVKLKLDWNDAFIEMLRKKGIGTVEQTEDEVIQIYLTLLQSEAGAIPIFDVQRQEAEIASEFEELDQLTAREILEAETALKRARRRQQTAERKLRIRKQKQAP